MRNILWGFTCFPGTTVDVRDGRNLGTLPEDDAIEGTFKFSQPSEWLNLQPSQLIAP